MAQFELPDPKKKAGIAMGLLLLAGAGVAVYAYLLPFLLGIVWGTVELIAGLAISGVLLYILLNKTFWRRLQIIIDSLGEGLFGVFIDMNPFNILMLQVSQAQKDRLELQNQGKILRGQEEKLRMDINDRKTVVAESKGEMEVASEILQKNPDDEEAAIGLESATVRFTNASEFIERVGPIQKDLAELVTLADKAYRKSGAVLDNMKDTIASKRAEYEAVTAGEKAMSRAMRAFTGDPDLNNAADKALLSLRKDVANKLGAMKESIKVTSRAMNERDLKDAGKVRAALNEAKKMDSELDAAPMMIVSNLHTPEAVLRKGNKYLSK